MSKEDMQQDLQHLKEQMPKPGFRTPQRDISSSIQRPIMFDEHEGTDNATERHRKGLLSLVFSAQDDSSDDSLEMLEGT